jgi:hypothetical protein
MQLRDCCCLLCSIVLTGVLKFLLLSVSVLDGGGRWTGTQITEGPAPLPWIDVSSLVSSMNK